MNEQAIVLRNDALRTFEYTSAANAIKEAALATGALVGRVNNADEQRAAVAAQTEVARVLKLAEQARKVAKEPVLDFGRQIDDQAKGFIKELKEEELRLAKMVGDFQALEQKRIWAAQQAENERLATIERERAQAVAQAKDHDDLDEIQSRFDQRAKDEAPPIRPIAKAEGQAVRNDWDVTVTDIWLLAKAHPTCVRIEPLVGEIKTLLKAGVKVAGVSATPMVKSQVRPGRELPAINV